MRTKRARCGISRIFLTLLLTPLLAGINYVAPLTATATGPLTYDPSWGTNTVTTPSYDGECTVCTAVAIGNIVYIGGHFTELTPPAGSTATPIQVSNLAAFDATSGQPITTWRPQADGRVFKLAAAPDGQAIYAGGQFASVNGVVRRHLTALDPATGAVIGSWQPITDGTVRALVVTSNRVYFGGSFNHVDGVARAKLAAVDTNTGALDQTWAPAIGPAGVDSLGHLASQVQALLLSSNGQEIYAGGYWATIGGMAQPAAAAIRLDGTIDTHFRPRYSYLPTDAVHSNSVFDFALSTVGGTPQLYVAGGGWANFLDRIDPASGQQVWRLITDGDVQTVTTTPSGEIYAGGHFRLAIDTSGQRFARVHVMGVDPAGIVDPGWQPSLGPAIAPSFYGCWMIRWINGALYAGGEFTNVNGAPQAHLAVFR